LTCCFQILSLAFGDLRIRLAFGDLRMTAYGVFTRAAAPRAQGLDALRHGACWHIIVRSSEQRDMRHKGAWLKVSEDWKKTAAAFLAGQAVTLFGTMITGHAITWYITLQTQSGAMMTLFAVATMVPVALSSPLGGVWADRYNRRYLINIVDAGIALVTLAMALFFSAGIQWLGLLLICVLARGFGQGIQMPAVTAILPEIVPADQLVRINGFNSSIQSLSMFASPMLAATLLTFFPIQILMYVDAVTAALGIAIVVLFVRTHRGWRRHPAMAASQQPAAGGLPEDASEPGAEPVTGHVTGPGTGPGAGGRQQRPGFFAEMKDGLRYMLAHRFIIGLMVMGVVFNILATPPAMLTPLQVTRDFGADAWRLGGIEVAFSVGMMLGGVLIGVWGGFKNRVWTMALATLCFGLGTIGLGLLGNFWVYLACMAFVGVIMPMFNAPMMGLLQERIEADYLGRVFSVFMMIGSLSMPVGMLLFGPLADLVAIDWLLIATGAGIAALSVYMVANRQLRAAGIPQGGAAAIPQGGAAGVSAAIPASNPAAIPAAIPASNPADKPADQSVLPL
jgi:DHA3 family macrolide efflux protein-like MFS transporter